MADAHSDFFTWNSLGTLAGGSIAVIIVTNTLQRARKKIYPTLPLVISMIITFGTSLYAGQLNGVPDWVLAFLNGCLLYCTATGANERIVDVAAGQKPGAQVHAAIPRAFFSSWVRRNSAIEAAREVDIVSQRPSH
jgi:hypothetical protein